MGKTNRRLRDKEYKIDIQLGSYSRWKNRKESLIARPFSSRQKEEENIGETKLENEVFPSPQVGVYQRKERNISGLH